jgi:hypothetical protein
MGNPKRRKWRKLAKKRKQDAIAAAARKAEEDAAAAAAEEVRKQENREYRKIQSEMIVKKKRERAEAIYSIRRSDLTEATEEEIEAYRKELSAIPIKELKRHLKDSQLPIRGKKDECIERLILFLSGKL